MPPPYAPFPPLARGKGERRRLHPPRRSRRAPQVAGLLAIPYNEPLDRPLIAQAQAKALTLVFNEGVFDSFGVMRLW